MTKLEAAALVAMLVNAYPNTKFTEENAALYEERIIDLPANETQAAIGELIHSNRYLPSVAEIREEVTRAKRRRVTDQNNAATRLALPPGPRDNGPTREQWAATLRDLLEQSAQWRRIAEPWYRKRGKPMPPDPIAPYIDIAKAGSEGRDVRGRVREQALGDQDELARRYP